MSTSMIALLATALVVGLVVVLVPAWVRGRRVSRPPQKTTRRWTVARVVLVTICTLGVLLPVQVAIGMLLGVACGSLGCTAQDLVRPLVLVPSVIVSFVLALALGWVMGDAIGRAVKWLSPGSPRKPVA